jgi:ABC-type multidrug transport system permease subunit
MTKKTIQKHEEDYFHIKKTTILKTGVYIILQLITLYMLICFLCGVDITTSDVFYWDTFGNFLVSEVHYNVELRMSKLRMKISGFL